MIVRAGELYHHGILGMKWGVKNGPPYPLNESVSSRIKAKAKEVSEHHAENKAKRSEGRSQVAEIDKKIAKTTEKFSKACVERDEKGAALAMKELEELNSKREKAQKEHGLLTDKQKTALATGLMVGAGVALIGYGIHKANQAAKTDGRLTWSENDRKRNALRKEFFLHGKLEDLPDQDMTIKAGHVFNRVDTHGHLGYNKKDGARMDGIYCACNDKDAARYRQMLVRVWNRGDARGNFHSIQFTMDHDVKVPSARKRYSQFVSLMQSDPWFVNAMYKAGMIYQEDIRLNQYGMFNPEKTRQMMAKAEPRQFANYYQMFSERFIGKSEAHRMYAEALAKQGYNAIIDDNDAGRLSDAPLILLDAAGLTVKSDTIMNRNSKAFEREGRTYDKYRNKESGRAFLVHRTGGGAMVVVPTGSDELYHYGVLGMKWGVRKAERVQNRINRNSAKAAKYRAKATARRAKAPGMLKNWASDSLRGKARRLEDTNRYLQAKSDIMTSDKKATAKQKNRLYNASQKVFNNNQYFDNRALGVYERSQRSGMSDVGATIRSQAGMAVRGIAAVGITSAAVGAIASYGESIVRGRRR